MQVGKKADILIFRCDTPGMLATGTRNPIGAIVLNSMPRDIETVIVDGIFRKHEGKLQDVLEVVDDGLLPTQDDRRITWPDVVREIEISSKSIEERRAAKCDYQIAVDGVINALYMNRQGMVENI